MKATVLFSALALAGSLGFAQNYPTAEQTVPDVMGWMKGFPPSQAKTLHASDGSFFEFPALRYSVNHMREFFPTRNVSSGNGKKYQLKTKLDPAIGNVTFTPWDSDKTMTFEESLGANYTDGIIVMHKGKIVYEKYPAGLKPDGLHAAMSVSKSFTGTIASILVAEGKLEPSKKVVEYIPELKDSGFADATVQEVMDMTTAVKYSEDYNNPNAEIWAYSAAGNVFRPADYTGPQNYYEYLATVKKLPDSEHGDAFGYRTVNTELLAWICSRVTGQGLADMVSGMIWKPLGAHYDGYYQVDPSGIAFAGGGFDLNLRDMAAFGEMMRNGGIMCITADHGNSDDMYEHAKDGSVKKDKDGEPKAKTSHSLNPVPGIIYDPEYKGEYDNTKLNDGLGISSWPATIMNLMGYVPPTDYDKSMVNLK